MPKLPQPITLSSTNAFPSPRGRRLFKPWPSQVNADFYTQFMSYGQLKLTPPVISNILQSAEMGNPIDQALLSKAVQEKEPIIAAHLQTRKLAILARQWHVLPSPHAPDQNVAESKAREATKILKNSGITELLEHLVSAISDGYAGALIDWKTGPLTSIGGFHVIDQANWSFSRSGSVAIRDSHGRMIVLDTDNSYQVVFHKYLMKSGIPSTGGLIRCLLWIYFFKHVGMQEQARYLEKYGIPYTIAKIRQEDFINEDIREQIVESLQYIGADGSMVVTEGTEVQISNPPTTSGNSSFTNWFKYLDDHFALLILGQKASMAEAGGFSSGQIQENVRHDLLSADCRSLSETVQNQIVRCLEYFKWGSEGDIYFEIASESLSAQKDKATRNQILANAGYKIPAEAVAEDLGIPILGADDPLSKSSGKGKSAAKDKTATLPPQAPVPSEMRNIEQPQPAPQALAQGQPSEGELAQEAQNLGVQMSDGHRALALADGLDSDYLGSLAAAVEGQPGAGGIPFDSSSQPVLAEEPERPKEPQEAPEPEAVPAEERERPSPATPAASASEPAAAPAQLSKEDQQVADNSAATLRGFIAKAAQGDDGASYEDWKASLNSKVAESVDDTAMRIVYADAVNQQRMADVRKTIAEALQSGRYDPAFFNRLRYKQEEIYDAMIQSPTYKFLPKKAKGLFVGEQLDIAQQLADAARSSNPTRLAAYEEAWNAWGRHFQVEWPKAFGGLLQAFGDEKRGADVKKWAEDLEREKGFAASAESQEASLSNPNYVARLLTESTASAAELVVGSMLTGGAVNIATAGRAAKAAQMGTKAAQWLATGEAESAAAANVVAESLEQGIRAWKTAGEFTGWAAPALVNTIGRVFPEAYDAYKNDVAAGLLTDREAYRSALGEAFSRGAVSIAANYITFTGIGSKLSRSLEPTEIELAGTTVGSLLRQVWGKATKSSEAEALQAGASGVLQGLVESFSNDLIDGLRGNSQIVKLLNDPDKEAAKSSKLLVDNIVASAIGAVPFVFLGAVRPTDQAIREFRAGLHDLYQPRLDPAKFERPPRDADLRNIADIRESLESDIAGQRNWIRDRLAEMEPDSPEAQALRDAQEFFSQDDDTRIRIVRPGEESELAYRDASKIQEAVRNLLGREVVLYEAMGKFADFIASGFAYRGKMFLNTRMDDALPAIAAHELAHLLSKNPAAAGLLSRAVREFGANLPREMSLPAKYSRKYSMLKAIYPDRPETEIIRQAKEEVTADILGQALGRSSFWQDAAMLDKSGAQRIAAAFKDAVDGMARAFAGAKVDPPYYIENTLALKRLARRAQELVDSYAPGMKRVDVLIASPDLVPQRSVVWHGTPSTDLDGGRLSLDYVGGGDSEQAFGWGLYFASSRDIAEAYRGAPSARAGAVYQAHIPKDDVLLDWDAAAQDQPPAVARSLKSIPEKVWRYAGMQARRIHPGAPVITGGDLYQSLEMVLGVSDTPELTMQINKLREDGHNITLEDHPSRKASEYLKALGIPGLRYLDAFSRGGDVENPTRNYVVFDDAAVDLLAKFSPSSKAYGGGELKNASTAMPKLEKAQLHLNRVQELIGRWEPVWAEYDAASSAYGLAKSELRAAEARRAAVIVTDAESRKTADQADAAVQLAALALNEAGRSLESVYGKANKRLRSKTLSGKIGWSQFQTGHDFRVLKDKLQNWKSLQSGLWQLVHTTEHPVLSEQDVADIGRAAQNAESGLVDEGRMRLVRAIVDRETLPEATPELPSEERKAMRLVGASPIGRVVMPLKRYYAAQDRTAKLALLGASKAKQGFARDLNAVLRASKDDYGITDSQMDAARIAALKIPYRSAEQFQGAVSQFLEGRLPAMLDAFTAKSASREAATEQRAIAKADRDIMRLFSLDKDGSEAAELFSIEGEAQPEAVSAYSESLKKMASAVMDADGSNWMESLDAAERNALHSFLQLSESQLSDESVDNVRKLVIDTFSGDDGEALASAVGNSLGVIMRGKVSKYMANAVLAKLDSVRRSAGPGGYVDAVNRLVYDLRQQELKDTHQHALSAAASLYKATKSYVSKLASSKAGAAAPEELSGRQSGAGQKLRDVLDGYSLTAKGRQSALAEAVAYMSGEDALAAVGWQLEHGHSGTAKAMLGSLLRRFGPLDENSAWELQNALLEKGSGVAPENIDAAIMEASGGRRLAKDSVDRLAEKFNEVIDAMFGGGSTAWKPVLDFVKAELSEASGGAILSAPERLEGRPPDVERALARLALRQREEGALLLRRDELREQLSRAVSGLSAEELANTESLRLQLEAVESRLNRMDVKSFDEMSTPQLKEFIAEVSAAKANVSDLAKQRLAAAKSVAGMRTAAIVRELASAPQRSRVKEHELGVVKFAKSVAVSSLRPQTAIGWLAGFERGELYNQLFRRAVDMSTHMTSLGLEFDAALSRALGSVNLLRSASEKPSVFPKGTAADLSKGLRLDQAMVVYALSSDPQGRAHLAATKELCGDVSDIAKIVEALPQEYKQAVDDVKAMVVRGVSQPVISSAYERLCGAALPDLPGWWTIRNLKHAGDDAYGSFVGLARRRGVSAASTKARTGSVAPFDVELMSFTGDLQRLRSETIRYGAQALPLSQMAAVVYEPSIVRAMDARSPRIRSYVQNWHQYITNPWLTTDPFSVAWTSALRYVVAPAQLLIAPKTVLLNFTGLPQLLAEHPAASDYIRKNTPEVVLHHEWIYDKSAMMRQRASMSHIPFERILGSEAVRKQLMGDETLRTAIKSWIPPESVSEHPGMAAEHVYNKAVAAVMSGLYGSVDQYCACVGWASVYLHAIEGGASEVQAVRLAEDAVVKSQHTAGHMFSAPSFRPGSAAYPFTLFMSPMSRWMNLLVEKGYDPAKMAASLPSEFRAGRGAPASAAALTAAAGAFVCYMSLPMMTALVSSGGRAIPWNAEGAAKLAEETVNCTFGGIPGIYWATNALWSMFDNTWRDWFGLATSFRPGMANEAPPPLSTPIRFLQSLYSVLSGEDKSGRDAENVARMASGQLSKLCNPTALRQALKYSDPRYLIYSPYILGEANAHPVSIALDRNDELLDAAIEEYNGMFPGYKMHAAAPKNYFQYPGGFVLTLTQDEYIEYVSDITRRFYEGMGKDGLDLGTVRSYIVAARGQPLDSGRAKDAIKAVGRIRSNLGKAAGASRKALEQQLKGRIAELSSLGESMPDWELEERLGGIKPSRPLPSAEFGAAQGFSDAPAAALQLADGQQAPESAKEARGHTQEELAQGEQLLRLIQLGKHVDDSIAKAKGKLAPAIENSPMTLPEGTISYAAGYESEIINRVKLRDIIMRALNLDAAKAEAVIRLATDRKANNPYVKVVRKHIKRMNEELSR